jgi:hypothetical protein
MFGTKVTLGIGTNLKVITRYGGSFSMDTTLHKIHMLTLKWKNKNKINVR